MVCVQIATLLRLGDLCQHGHNNKHLVTVREGLQSWLKQTNVDSRLETGSERRAPLFKSDVLFTHSSTSTSSLCRLCLLIFITSSRGLNGHLDVNICCFGALAETTDAVVFQFHSFSNKVHRTWANTLCCRWHKLRQRCLHELKTFHLLRLCDSKS